MKNLLSFIISKITGSSDFEVIETEEGERIVLEVKAKKEIIGLIIGKEGKTIKNIRKLLSVPAVLSHKGIAINVTEA